MSALEMVRANLTLTDCLIKSELLHFIHLNQIPQFDSTSMIMLLGLPATAATAATTTTGGATAAATGG